MRRLVLILTYLGLGVLVLPALSFAEPCIWQGGSGVWADTDHWSCWHVPLTTDDCILNSGSCVDSSCVVDFGAESLVECHDFTMLGFVGTLVFPAMGINVNGNLDVYNGSTLSASLNCTFALIGTGAHTISGAYPTSLLGDCAGFGQILLDAPGGTYTLQDPWNSQIVQFRFNNGTFDTNDFTFAIATWDQIGGVVDLGASVAGARAQVGLSNVTAGTSTFVARGLTTRLVLFNAGGVTFNNVLWQPSDPPSLYSSVDYGGDWTAVNLTLDPGTLAEYSGSPADDKTITLDTLGCTGLSGVGEYIQMDGDQFNGSLGSQITLAMTAQPICDYFVLKNVHCTVGGNPPWPTPGGTPCIAGANSIDLGNNLGWLFSSTPPNSTYTPTPTITDTPTSTETPTRTATITATDTVTSTVTATAANTSTPTNTPLPPGPACCGFDPAVFGIACVDNTMDLGPDFSGALATPGVCATLAADILGATPAAVNPNSGCSPSGDTAGACNTAAPATPTPTPGGIGACTPLSLILNDPVSTDYKVWARELVRRLRLAPFSECRP